MNRDLRLFPSGVRILFIAVMGLLALLPGSAAAALGERYVDPEWGYTIRGPEGWEARPHAMEGISLVYLGSAYEGFYANLSVVALPEPIEVTPKFVEQMVRNLEAQMEIAAGDASQSGLRGDPDEARPRGFRVARRTIAPVGGVDAAYLEASFHQNVNGGTRELRQLQVVIPGVQSHFILTYTAGTEVFEDALPDIQAAVNSFTPAVGPVTSTGGSPWFARRAGLLFALLALIACTTLVLLAIQRRRRGSRIP